MKTIIPILCGLLTLFIPFPFKPYTTGGDWYQIREGGPRETSQGIRGMGDWTTSPIIHHFEPWGIDTILVRLVIAFIAFIIVWGIIESILQNTESKTTDAM